MSIDNLTYGERFIFEWQYNIAGSFNSHLAMAISKADSNNLEKIKKSFPEEVQAMQDFRNIPGWWEDVLEKVEG